MIPQILVMDLETFPIEAYVWGLKDQNVGLNQIKQDWTVCAWAAKWLHEPASKVMYMDQRTARNPRNDANLIKAMWKLLDKADYVITQNGVNFDGPKLNARFIELGLPPPSPYKHVDTYQMLRKVAGFTSHKLEYLTNKLCKTYKKLDHGKFPGFSLWTECMKGNRAAWDEMKKYNIHDVLSTEELYKRVRAWAPQSITHIFVASCHVCGNGQMHKAGMRVTKGGLFQRLRCQGCGSWDKVKIKPK